METTLRNEALGIDKVYDEQVERADEHTEESRQTSPDYMSLTIPQTIRVFWRSVLIALSISIGASFDCYASLIPISIVGNAGFIQQFGTVPGLDGLIAAIEPSQLSNWSVITAAMNIAGLLIGGLIGDRYGRKVVLYVMALFIVIAVIISILASSPSHWSARGAFAGLAVGCLQGSLLPYLSEIAPSKIRGMFTSFYVFFWSIGIVAGGVALYAAELVDPLNWKPPFYAQFVFLGLFLPGLIFAPESPWYLARQGNEIAAKKSMRVLYGNVESYNIDNEYQSILLAISAENTSCVVDKRSVLQTYADCFRGVNLRRTLLAMMGMIAQAFSGVVLVFGYTVYFFRQAGYAKPFEANMIFACLQLAGVMTSFVAIDWLGRRPMLILGTGISTVACFSLGGIAFMETPSGPGMVACACLWVYFFAITLNPLGYGMIGEIPTQRLKAKTASIGLAVYAAINIVLSYIVPYMLSPLEWGWGLKSGLFFGGASFVMTIVVIIFAPETKGRTIVDLDEIFEARTSVRQFPRFQTSRQLQQPTAEDAELQK